MNDWTDQYLSRNIKNWMAHYQPPGGDKRELLRAIQSPFPARNRQLVDWLSPFKYLFSNQQTHYISRAGVCLPYTQASLWSFFFATNYHLVH